MTSETKQQRPDPRLAASWCREGVAHDHQACGLLWNSSDQADIEAAARWADDRGREREIMRQGAGRLMRRAAEMLRSPYLCNWDTAVAAALADWLDDEAAGPTGVKAEATARALLTSFGVDPTEPVADVTSHACGDRIAFRRTGAVYWRPPMSGLGLFVDDPGVEEVVVGEFQPRPDPDVS